MIDLALHGAQPLPGLPIAPRYVRTIESFEGPLLSEFQTDAGDTFLYQWCDSDERLNRWLVVRTPRQDLFSYLVRKTTLRTLIVECRDQFVYVLDTSRGTEQSAAAFFLPVSRLPDEYVPSADSWHQPERTESDRYQDVFIDDAWGYREVSEYPRKYIQAYAFNANFGKNGVRRPAQVDYRLDGGWAYHQLFGKFESYIPEPQRASLEAVSVASPGYVRFNVDPALAESLRRTVANFSAAKDAILVQTHGLRRWYLGHDRNVTDEQARREIGQLCARLGLNATAIIQQSDTLQNAAKALASYVNRIAFLAYRDSSGTAMLVGRPGPLEDTELPPDPGRTGTAG